MTASTATPAARDQSQLVPRSAVARIVITAKYAQIASSESDWKVAARDSRMRQPSSRCAPSANNGAVSATTTPRQSNSAERRADCRGKRRCRG